MKHRNIQCKSNKLHMNTGLFDRLLAQSKHNTFGQMYVTRRNITYIYRYAKGLITMDSALKFINK